MLTEFYNCNVQDYIKDRKLCWRDMRTDLTTKEAKNFKPLLESFDYITTGLFLRSSSISNEIKEWCDYSCTDTWAYWTDTPKQLYFVGFMSEQDYSYFLLKWQFNS